jgi:hypothetical protein
MYVVRSGSVVRNETTPIQGESHSQYQLVVPKTEASYIAMLFDVPQYLARKSQPNCNAYVVFKRIGLVLCGNLLITEGRYKSCG